MKSSSLSHSFPSHHALVTISYYSVKIRLNFLNPAERKLNCLQVSSQGNRRTDRQRCNSSKMWNCSANKQFLEPKRRFILTINSITVNGALDITKTIWSLKLIICGCKFVFCTLMLAFCGLNVGFFRHKLAFCAYKFIFCVHKLAFWPLKISELLCVQRD